MSVLMLFWQPATLLFTCFMLLLVILVANKMMMMMMMMSSVHLIVAPAELLPAAVSVFSYVLSFRSANAFSACIQAS